VLLLFFLVLIAGRHNHSYCAAPSVETPAAAAVNSTSLAPSPSSSSSLDGHSLAPVTFLPSTTADPASLDCCTRPGDASAARP